MAVLDFSTQHPARGVMTEIRVRQRLSKAPVGSDAERYGEDGKHRPQEIQLSIAKTTIAVAGSSENDAKPLLIGGFNREAANHA